MSLQLFQCTPAEIDKAWREGAHRLSEACKWASREITPDQLKFLLSRGERVLIGARDNEGVKGWAAVQVLQLPNIRVLHIYSLQGKGVCSAEGFELLKQYAQANGCSSIRGAVRASVMRMLRQRFGAQELYATAEIPV